MQSYISCLLVLMSLLSLLFSCLWSWTSWLWRRTMRCVGRSGLAGSSLKRMWRRRRIAGGNLMWPHSPSAVYWSFAVPSQMVEKSSPCSQYMVHLFLCSAEMKSTRINMAYNKKQNSFFLDTSLVTVHCNIAVKFVGLKLLLISPN